MSRTAKIIITLGTLFLVYFVYETINRENVRKEKINAIGEYFKGEYEIDEKLKEQYDDTFQVKVNEKVYLVTVPNDKVTKVKKLN
ncbi:hypothetical protein ACFFJY_10400 [Fictibacillus aquaticus]|uniref:PepSY domain-containing protein n=1 Tax=Fictibacillus aquaticus TaxID=2021314 RepID=A0A235FBU9_9BACL|nr:hypothetical protein [Fictibacillus aquaticus]OYD58669.1 hypothetical protein CGZ90_01845 [Fictibacillus aquaticus]